MHKHRKQASAGRGASKGACPAVDTASTCSQQDQTRTPIAWVDEDDEDVAPRPARPSSKVPASSSKRGPWDIHVQGRDVASVLHVSYASSNGDAVPLQLEGGGIKYRAEGKDDLRAVVTVLLAACFLTAATGTTW